MSLYSVPGTVKFHLCIKSILSHLILTTVLYRRWRCNYSHFTDEKTIGSERAKNLSNVTQQAEELDLPQTSTCNHGIQLPAKWLVIEIFALLTGAFYCEDVLVSAGWQKDFLLNIKSQSPFILSIFPARCGWRGTNAPPTLISFMLFSSSHFFHRWCPPCSAN